MDMSYFQIFSKDGQFISQFGIAGREEGHLWHPRKVTIIRNTQHYVVCDRGSERSRMQIFAKNGYFIRKIAIPYIDIVAGLAINSMGKRDSVEYRVFDSIPHYRTYRCRGQCFSDNFRRH